MNLIAAIRLTEILLALAFLQQSAEHFYTLRRDRYLFSLRILLSFLLLIGFLTQWVTLLLIILGLLILKRFQGPYNGGSDRMSYLVLSCLCLFYFLPTLQWKEYIFGYLAFQLVLSYFISGWVKISTPQWRNGTVLQGVFSFSAYPVSEDLRLLAKRQGLLFVMSWIVILFELFFPLTLLTNTTLTIGLTIGIIFHLSNACLFGLNRFLWIWLAAYPSVLWLHQRIFI